MASLPQTAGDQCLFSRTIYGPFTSKLYMAFKGALSEIAPSDIAVESRSLPLEKAFSAFEGAGIPVSYSQLFEMLHCAGHARTGKAEKLPKDLFFGEFCLFAAALLAARASRNAAVCCDEFFEMHTLITSAERYRPLDGDVAIRSECASDVVAYDIFLGGSCNPTTWRRDVVIPMLKSGGITFYNPQVDSWHPELMDIERSAKDNARLMFFVVDAQTRAVASMVEAAFFSGSGRPLVLVVRQLPDIALETSVDEVQLCGEEVSDLNNARAFLLDMAERAGVKVFMDEVSAVRFSSEVLQCSSRKRKDFGEPCYARVGNAVVSAQEVFTQCLSRGKATLSVDEVLVAVRAAFSNMPQHIDHEMIWSCLGARKEVTFQEFLCLLAELRNDVTSRRSWWLWRWLKCVRSTVQTVLEVYLEQNCLSQKVPVAMVTRGRRVTDVFLGGSCGNTVWRQQLAIPLLKQHGVSHYNPQVAEWSIQFIPLEAHAKENCRVLLFVVTGETRGAASLAEAAYYIGLQRTVVLCLQDISEGTVIGEKKLADRARKDYNRGRAYLADVANQHGVPIFDDVIDAVRCAITIVEKSRLTADPSL